MSPELNRDAMAINYQLRLMGKTQAQIAQEIGVSNGVVCNVSTAELLLTLLPAISPHYWEPRQKYMAGTLCI